MELPKSRIGKVTKRKTIHGNPMIYEVIDEEIFRSLSYKSKAFCLQKLRFNDGSVVFRISYYMIAVKPRMRGKWAFGQFAPMMTKKEMELIYKLAIRKGWISI
jgi:hypothetical protein